MYGLFFFYLHVLYSYKNKINFTKIGKFPNTFLKMYNCDYFYITKTLDKHFIYLKHQKHRFTFIFHLIP